jgi:hypothetical protein
VLYFTVVKSGSECGSKAPTYTKKKLSNHSNKVGIFSYYSSNSKQAAVAAAVELFNFENHLNKGEQRKVYNSHTNICIK